ncbi:hypothetical protein BC835DRAFT_1302450 [Cytidiella melzeri]|nr:hypothetical protein BC835DRAFT_1302450 [Cytidiella melzeri]
MPRVTSDFTAEDGLKWERYAEKSFGEWMRMQEQTQMTQEQARDRRFADQGRSKGPGRFKGSREGHRGGYQGDRGKADRGAYHPKNFAERVSPPREPKTKSYDRRKNRRKHQREQKGDNKIPVSEGGPTETYGNNVQEESSGTFTPLGEDEFTTSYDLIDDSEPMGCA